MMLIHRSMSIHKKVGILLLSVACFTLTGATGFAQEYENLQVLPKDISEEELRDVMGSFSAALGVRCGHCHVQNPPGERGMDFASDEKETKKVARAMVRMNRTINRHLLPEIGREDLTQVQCVTCHNGQAIPTTLHMELRTAFDAGGLDSATARYAELRNRYYGRAAFDFGERSLINVAGDFRKAGDTEAAIKLLTMNREYFPESIFTYSQLAEISQQNGNNDQARQYLQKALEIDPENGWIQRQLEELSSGE
ncbi:MAG: c-type cytochrome [Candidatus Marinimicrobia bacterium]|nr:c-type cytochrome [Candidatus Neomarinimicrobiota bacterium]MCF7828053.1 c-type cytochrome [Candidatus Neomarinimicrobiota bacterium]MCF7879192.1 c-type cytochrome [Candidatus Neomarinimicrobiota bacterium]